MKHLLPILAFFFLLSASPARAQEPASLELADLLVTLLEQDEGVQAAAASYESALNQVSAAKGAWRPSVDVSAEIGHEEITQTIKEPDNDATSKFRNEQDLTITQLIYDFGGTSGQVRMYEALSLEALARLEQAKQAALFRGINAYLSVIRYREILKYLDLSEAKMQEISGIQEVLVERGSALSTDELRVKAQLANVLAQKLRAEQEFSRALHNFKAVFEIEITPVMADYLKLPGFPGEFVPQGMDVAVNGALETNPRLLELEQAVQRAIHQVTMQESTFYPTLELVGEAQRKEQDQGAQGVRFEQRATLQMSINLYSGGTDTENLLAAKKNVTAAKKLVLEQRDTVEEGVRNAFTDMEIVGQQYDHYVNQTNLTWEYLQLIERLQEASGEVDLTAQLIGHRDYLSATSAMVTAKTDQIIAAYTLLFQMGRLSPQSIAPPAAPAEATNDVPVAEQAQP